MTSGPAGSPTSRYVRSRPSRVDTAPPATSRPSSSAIVTNLPLACTVDSYLKTAVALVLQHCACLDRKIRRAGNASDDLRGTCCVGEHNAHKRATATAGTYRGPQASSHRTCSSQERTNQ